jgi:hypothetical protein
MDEIIESHVSVRDLYPLLAGLFFHVATRWNLTIPKLWYWESMCELYPWHVLFGALLQAWRRPPLNEELIKTTRDGGTYYAQIVRELYAQAVEERLDGYLGGCEAQTEEKVEEPTGLPAGARRGSARGRGKPGTKKAA